MFAHKVLDDKHTSDWIHQFLPSFEVHIPDDIRSQAKNSSRLQFHRRVHPESFSSKLFPKCAKSAVFTPFKIARDPMTVKLLLSFEIFHSKDFSRTSKSPRVVILQYVALGAFPFQFSRHYSRASQHETSWVKTAEMKTLFFPRLLALFICTKTIDVKMKTADVGGWEGRRASGGRKKSLINTEAHVHVISRSKRKSGKALRTNCCLPPSCLLPPARLSFFIISRFSSPNKYLNNWAERDFRVAIVKRLHAV